MTSRQANPHCRGLIVDLEADCRCSVKATLPVLEAIEVSDGKETLAMIERDRLNLEITDIRMPKMKASVCWGICTANYRSYQ